MLYTPKTELDSRIKKLQKKLLKQDIDAALIIYNADKFYFAGTVQNSYLFVPAEGEPILFVIKSIERAHKESCLEKIVELPKLRNLPLILKKYGYSSLSTIGIEADVLPARLYHIYDTLFAHSKLVDISSIIRSIRMLKSTYEIEIIRKAGEMSAEIFSSVRDNLKEGMSEFEMISIIEKLSREKGHPGYIRARGFNREYFYIQFFSGRDSAMPSYGGSPLGGLGTSVAFPQGSSNKIINRNEPIIFDYEAWVEGYMADMTRTFCIGKLPNHMTRAYDASLEILGLLNRLAKPGITCGELYKIAREKAIEHGLENHFMGMHKPVPFIAHGVGLEVDELPILTPRNKTLLEKNMVIAIEPKFVFEDGAIGIENTYVVDEKGLSNLTVFDENIQYLNFC